jgi:uncharacterized membrane protein
MVVGSQITHAITHGYMGVLSGPVVLCVLALPLQDRASTSTSTRPCQSNMGVFKAVPLLPILLASYLALSGMRKGSLSPSGGAAAFVAGAVMMAVPLRVFGVSLIVFYLTGSRATKVGKELKAKLEDAHQAAGYRNASQVFCNALSAFVASLLWSAIYVPGSLAQSMFSSVVSPQGAYDLDRWCPLTPPASSHMSRALLFVTLGWVFFPTVSSPYVIYTIYRHFACCLGDTLASELGILSKSRPRLVTTFQIVPPGTNGGMSPFGTFASLCGGVIMGITISVSLLIQSSRCRSEWYQVVLPLVGWGAFAGLFGSFVSYEFMTLHCAFIYPGSP